MPALAQGSSLAQVSQADCHMQGSTRKGFRPRDCIRELIVYPLIDSYTDLTIHIGIPDKLPNDPTLQPSALPSPPRAGGFSSPLREAPPSQAPLRRTMMEHGPQVKSSLNIQRTTCSASLSLEPSRIDQECTCSWLWGVGEPPAWALEARSLPGRWVLHSRDISNLFWQRSTGTS